jgi:DNA polymerase-1
VTAKAETDGFVTTIMDRRRYLPELKSSDRNVKAFAQRMAVNTPIQGSAADLIKMAMICLYRRLGEEKFGTKMILQVHDELVFEAPEAQADSVRAAVVQEMVAAYSMEPALCVDAGVGEDWASAK